MMAHLLVRQKVEDYAKWKAAFDADAAVRAPNGSKGGHIFQSASDPNEVFILLQWDTMENLREFTQSAELKARMQRAGVVGQPEIYFLNLSDSPSA